MADRHATREPRLGRARVLVLLDRPVLAAIVTLTLSHCAAAIRATTTAAESVAVIREWQPHLAILDMDLDGRLVMAQIAVTADGIRPATIGLTRRGDLRTKLAALETDVDDTLTTPFALEELVARVIALLRRTYSDVLTFSPVIRLGELEVDILDSTLAAGTAPKHRLTPLEQSLLYLLAANAGHVISREQILDTLWGVDYVAESSVVDRHIRSLRAKLQGDRQHPPSIVTVPGRGFRFTPGPNTA